MWRIGRVLAILAIGWFFLLAPAATAAPEAPVHTAAPVGAAVVREQAPPVGQPPASPGTGQPALPLDNRRVVIGAMGFLLIVLVLLSRRWRKLPMFGFTWKRKG